MAQSYLGRANFHVVADSGMARAKKLADIYIKSHTDDSGTVNDPNVYQYAIDNYLAPYADDLTVASKIAGYENNIKKVGEKGYDQSVTLAGFKREVENAIYTSDQRLVRDPWTLAQYTSEELDKALYSVNLAIDHLKATGKSVDQLITYRTQLNGMASAQRELVNNIAQGTVNPNLDGYGYFVKTNPANGALTGAALLPTNYAPSGVTDGNKRLETSLQIGGAKIPVYLPATKNADGEYEARLYGDVWKGSGDSPLGKDSGDNFGDGNFDISDAAKFPVKSFDLAPGQFGRKMTGVDTGGNSVYTYFYRGVDGSVHSIDQNSLNLFKQDPIMAQKLNTFVPTLGDDDVRGFGNVTPLDQSIIAQDKKAVLQSQASDAAAASAAANEKYQRLNTGVVGALADVGGVIQKGVSAVGGFFSNMFGRKNRQSTPTEAPVSSNGQYSPKDVVQSGSSFFKGKVQG